MNNLAVTYQHIADILSFETASSQLETTLSDPSFDWDIIVKVGSKHYVIPAIYCRLKTKELLHLLPEDLINYLELIAHENRKRNLIIKAQISDISKLLNSHNIMYTFLKGSALLTLGCYNDVAERMLGDIDILVKDEDLDEAYELLIKADYKPINKTLGNDFIEHKHLPRLVTELNENRIAAVEVHKKLFTTYNYQELKPEFIFNDVQQINAVIIPSLQHLLMHNILHYQVSDHGSLYNSISFKSAYDTIILLQNYSGTKAWYKAKKIKKYFKYSSLFFSEIKTSTNAKPDLFTYFYLFKLKHITLYKYWNKLLGFGRFISILLNRFLVFISNSTYRNAVIKDKKRVFTQFKSILDKF